jgi:hypothetical protein
MVSNKTRPCRGKPRGDPDMPNKKITRTARMHKEKIVTRPHNLFASLPAITLQVASIKNMFKEKTICHIARATGFIQRQGKLNVYDFFCP